MNDYNEDDEWVREAAEEEADRQRKAQPAPVISHEEFLAWRSPCKVNQQATRLDNPLWNWLVRTRWDAYNANEKFKGPSAFSAGPMWCFMRYGMSETLLPDGRVVYIGGEHEDHYDPDFFIYNDVILIQPDGGIAIYGYPVEDFPPTDFHSATLVGNTIFVIGCLGYPHQRLPGTTPVYKLSLDSMRIDRVETHGKPPGWISMHKASIGEDEKSVIITGGEVWLGESHAMSENIDAWSLNTVTGEWLRLTEHNWQRWIMRRMDLKPSRILDVRQALWNREHAELGLEGTWRYEDEPDFDALEMLYRLDEGAPKPEQEAEYKVYMVVIDGVKVRFKEERFWIEAIVEGRLAEERLHALQNKTLELMARLEGAPCEIENSVDSAIDKN